MREEFQTVLDGIAKARREPFKGHPLAAHIINDWRHAVAAAVQDESYKIVGSPGKGVWAQTVWLSVFDRMVTESAQQGFYLVYLVRSDGTQAFLSLNQGTEEIYSQVGGKRYRQVLEDTAARDRGLLTGEETHALLEGPLELGSSNRLTRGYESGNIFAAEYTADKLPSNEELEDDLTRLLLLYRSLVEARDRAREDDVPPMHDDRASSSIEAGRVRWHRRAERSRVLATQAKKLHGTRCQVKACSKDLSSVYGDMAKGFIEAHHLTPFSSLEGRPTELDPQTDFAVVCPDCHRMLHRRREPYSLEELSAKIEAARA
jgi:5-methylcytosine-specific restriction enzyme A